MAIFKNIHPVALILSVVVMHYLVGAIPTLPIYFLVTSYIIAFILIARHGRSRIEQGWLYFLLFIPCTIILAQPASVFRSWERYVLFVFLFLVCSPILQSDYTRQFRKNILNCVIIISVILSVGSFAAYFLGINFCTNEGDYIVDYVGVAGHFSGLTRQSMFLGPLSGISSVYLSYQYLSSKNKKWFILLIPCIGAMFFASSRSAFLATIAGMITVLFYFAGDKKEFVKYLTGIMFVIAITFPIWKSATSALQDKQNIHKDDTELFDSRSGKVEQRFSEFLSSPIWGVGFSAIDENGKDPYNRITGTVEPGSSWLAILSMTGIVGFIMFFSLFRRTFYYVKLYKTKAFLSGMLVFYAVHMLVEGYIFAAGNPNAFIVWLVIGMCYDSKFDDRMATRQPATISN